MSRRDVFQKHKKKKLYYSKLLTGSVCFLKYCPNKHFFLTLSWRYFHFYNTGLQNQSVLYMQENLEAKPSVFLDPNTFSEDGTVALQGAGCFCVCLMQCVSLYWPSAKTCSLFSGYAFSEDGEYLAYGTSASGSDWVEIQFLRVDGAVLLEDRLERVKFTCMSWTHDGKGLFYNSYPEQEGKSDGKHAWCTNSHMQV